MAAGPLHPGPGPSDHSLLEDTPAACTYLGSVKTSVNTSTFAQEEMQRFLSVEEITEDGGLGPQDSGELWAWPSRTRQGRTRFRPGGPGTGALRPASLSPGAFPSGSNKSVTLTVYLYKSHL